MTEPLTLQKLAKMDGQPVWVGEPINSWRKVCVHADVQKEDLAGKKILRAQMMVDGKLVDVPNAPVYQHSLDGSLPDRDLPRAFLGTTKDEPKKRYETQKLMIDGELRDVEIYKVPEFLKQVPGADCRECAFFGTMKAYELGLPFCWSDEVAESDIFALGKQICFRKRNDTD